MLSPAAHTNRRFCVGVFGGLLLAAALNVYSYVAHFHAPRRYDEIVYFGLPFRIYYTGWIGTDIFWPGVVANLLVAIAAGGFVGLWCDKLAKAKAVYP